jgi:hypothetical protein
MGPSRSKYRPHVAAELRCSRRRIVSASTPSRDGNTPRTARARARAAARRPPGDITWRYAHRRAITALAVHRRRGCLAQAPRPRAAVRAANAAPHNTRYVAGRRAAHRARAQALRACVHATALRLRPRAWASTGACVARPRTCAHPLSRVRPRGLRLCASGCAWNGIASSSLQSPRALCLRVGRGACCCRPSVAPCSSRQGQGELLRKP